jgi:hypothetical protein
VAAQGALGRKGTSVNVVLNWALREALDHVGLNTLTNHSNTAAHHRWTLASAQVIKLQNENQSLNDELEQLKAQLEVRMWQHIATTWPPYRATSACAATSAALLYV